MRYALTRAGMHAGCSKRPSFNYKGEAQAVLCAAHKLPHMFNLRARPCSVAGCEEEGKYPLPGKDKQVVCDSHRPTDVPRAMRRMCHFDGCDKRASCNFEGVCPCCQH